MGIEGKPCQMLLLLLTEDRIVRIKTLKTRGGGGLIEIVRAGKTEIAQEKQETERK